MSKKNRKALGKSYPLAKVEKIEEPEEEIKNADDLPKGKISLNPSTGELKVEFPKEEKPQINVQINNTTQEKELTPDPNTAGWAPKTKGVKTYNFLNSRGEIVGAVLLSEEGLSQKAISRIVVAFVECGFNVQQGTSLEAGALFERQLIPDQKDLFPE